MYEVMTVSKSHIKNLGPTTAIVLTYLENVFAHAEPEHFDVDGFLPVSKEFFEKELGYSEEALVKAFNNLKSRGIIQTYHLVGTRILVLE